MHTHTHTHTHTLYFIHGLKQQFSTCGLQSLGGWTTLSQVLPKTILHIRFIKIHNSSKKSQLWSSYENNFMVGGQHNMRYCVKGSQHYEGWDRWLLGLSIAALTLDKSLLSRSLYLWQAVLLCVMILNPSSSQHECYFKMCHPSKIKNAYFHVHTLRGDMSFPQTLCSCTIIDGMCHLVLLI